MNRQKILPAHWSDEMYQLLMEKYTRYGKERFARLFNKTFGTNYAPVTLGNIAWAHGCTESDSAPNHYSVAELAELLDLTKQAVTYQIGRGSIKARRHGRRWMVPVKEVDRLIEIYAPTAPPWPAYTVKEAAVKLGYSHTTNNIVGELARKGRLEYVLIRRKMYVPKADIDAAEQYLQKTGETFVPWSQPERWRSQY